MDLVYSGSTFSLTQRSRWICHCWLRPLSCVQTQLHYLWYMMLWLLCAISALAVAHQCWHRTTLWLLLPTVQWRCREANSNCRSQQAPCTEATVSSYLFWVDQYGCHTEILLWYSPGSGQDYGVKQSEPVSSFSVLLFHVSAYCQASAKTISHQELQKIPSDRWDIQKITLIEKKNLFHVWGKRSDDTEAQCVLFNTWTPKAYPAHI